VSEHLFLAVPLPMQIKEKLSSFSKSWYGQLPFKKWTYQDDFHITLSFLGPVTYTKSNELVKQLQEELKNFKSFSLTLQNLGTFGDTKQPRVWWCGVNKSNELLECQKRVSKACESVGFTIEKRPYSPHITLAKKFNDGFNKDFEVPLLWDENNIEFEVNEIVLYKIHPSKQPSYEPIEMIKLLKD